MQAPDLLELLFSEGVLVMLLYDIFLNNNLLFFFFALPVFEYACYPLTKLLFQYDITLSA